MQPVIKMSRKPVEVKESLELKGLFLQYVEENMAVFKYVKDRFGELLFFKDPDQEKELEIYRVTGLLKVACPGFKYAVVGGEGFNAWGFERQMQEMWHILKHIPEDFDGTLEELAGTEIYRGYIFRTRLNYQFTKRLFLRLVLQYDNFDELFDLDPLLTYRINPFSAFYIGSALDYQDFGRNAGIAQTERTYFFKFQYLFNL